MPDQMPSPTPTPATSVVDTQVVSPQDFAQKVKTKYPEYSSMSDGALVQKILQKYPEYGNQIKGYAQDRKTHQGALVMTGKESEDLGFSKPTPKTRTDKFADFITRNDPTIGATVGSIGGGAVSGLPGAVAGAAAGGAAGSALKQKVEGGKVGAKETAKAGGEQAAWELFGGAVGKGIAKTAQLLGLPEAAMKFALKTGEDLEQGTNPAAAMNKFKIRSAMTSDLFRKTGEQIGSLSKVADGIMDQALPYSSTVRPYAVIKGVLSKYEQDAIKTADPQIRKAMQDMLENVGEEFNNASTGAQGVARQEAQKAVTSGKPLASGAETYQRIQKLPTDKIMSIKDANALKRTWGDTVDWSKEPVSDKMQAVFTAEMSARREIYNALNKSIADSMGGNEGKIWLAKNKDIQNLMEAKSLINKSAKNLQSHGQNIFQSLSDLARDPGWGSRIAQGAEVGEQAAQMFGSNLPNLGRGAVLGADAAMGNNSVPPQK